MVAAFLTTIFFSLSAIFANRSIAVVGPVRANLGRLFVALVLLAVYAHTTGGGLGGAGRDWFIFSGVVGMGLGDLASFAALPLLGSRLTVLMVQCLAVPMAMVAEWFWLGTTLRPSQVGWSFVILAGVLVALLPSRKNPPAVVVKRAGFVLGFLAACGQGLGAVISRKANALTALAGEPIDGITAAYQRIVGGFVLTLIYFAMRSLLAKKTDAAPPKPSATPAWRGYLWITVNALCGAVIGVSCYQWALATTPSGIVLPIVATTPLVIVPLSYWLEGKKPAGRSFIGGVIAVAGVIALTLVR
ncbi:MAG: DMT family transporter [Opitutaceae bacterium]